MFYVQWKKPQKHLCNFSMGRKFWTKIFQSKMPYTFFCPQHKAILVVSDDTVVKNPSSECLDLSVALLLSIFGQLDPTEALTS